ncbi:hypothetical protein D6825_03490 [Candidatus Woesearchaeota archaeon]|nr:MAG: hypothetical protein D6825_03490 [Candidatus Woesearchaeota archaeon]
MQKHLLLLFALVSIGAIAFLYDMHIEMTSGRLVNSLALVRLERIEKAREGLQMRQLQPQECILSARDIERYLRLGADERYFSPAGLHNPQEFFINERFLISQLNALEKNERCPDAMRERARDLKKEIVAIDANLVVETIRRSACPDTKPAEEIVEYALNASSSTDAIGALERAARYSLLCTFKDAI